MDARLRKDDLRNQTIGKAAPHVNRGWTVLDGGLRYRHAI
jgi:hypothetical protein